MRTVARRHSIVRPAASAFIDSDTFTRADSTTNPGSTTGGRAWVASRGTWGISLNQAYTSVANSTGEGAVMYADFGTANVTITLAFTTMGSTNTGGGIVFRYVDINNYWLLSLYRSNVGGTPQWYLVRTVTGSITNVVGPVTASFGTTATASVITSGSSITSIVDGVTVDTRSDSTFSTATKHGLNIYNSVGVGLDNFTLA